MTTIPIDLIRPSPHPVRSSWDEDKMTELAASIAEQGMIVPVKVRCDGEACRFHGYHAIIGGTEETDGLSRALTGSDYSIGSQVIECDWCAALERSCGWDRDESDEPPGPCFELVYGHRRVEAARRAGHEVVPVIVEGVDDKDVLIQALIENVQREDMEPQDVYDSAMRLMGAMGWRTVEVLAEHGVLGLGQANRLRTFGSLPADVRGLVGTPDSGKPLGVKHVDSAARGGGAGRGAPHRVDVLRKAASDGLTTKQTRAVAESIAAAPDDKVRETLLTTPYSPHVHDAETVKAEPELYRENKQRLAADDWRDAPGVSEPLVGLKAIVRGLAKWGPVLMELMELGKLAPEHRPYVVKRLRTIAERATKYANELEASNG